MPIRLTHLKQTRTRNDGYHSRNRVQLVRGGRSYFDLLKKLLAKAKSVIHLQFYIFEEDETGRSVAQALMEAARRGVKVYMLVDAYGSQGLSQVFVKSLRDAGVHFRRFRPLFKSRHFYFGRRLHHKVVVVDSMHALVSGLNISDRYNDMPGVLAWLDWALHVEGEAAAAVEEICKRRLRLRYTIKPPSLPRGGVPVRVRVNDWGSRKREIFRSYLEIFEQAESQITIMSAYFLPGRSFRRHIVAARRRGVQVRVILTADADVLMIKYAERYIYRWLFKHGISVYEYGPSMVHGKMALCDNRWMTLGSYNVNNLSAYGSVELNLDVKDEEFVTHVNNLLDELIDRDCLPVTEKQFLKKFNAVSRFFHKTAYVIFRFLFFVSTRRAGD